LSSFGSAHQGFFIFCACLKVLFNFFTIVFCAMEGSLQDGKGSKSHSQDRFQTAPFLGHSKFTIFQSIECGS